LRLTIKTLIAINFFNHD